MSGRKPSRSPFRIVMKVALQSILVLILFGFVFFFYQIFPGLNEKAEISTPTATPPSGRFDPPRTGQIKAGGATVRESADFGSAEMIQLDGGTNVSVIAYDEDWFEIEAAKLSMGSGWVLSDFVEFISVISTPTPVVADEKIVQVGTFAPSLPLTPTATNTLTIDLTPTISPTIAVTSSLPISITQTPTVPLKISITPQITSSVPTNESTPIPTGMGPTPTTPMSNQEVIKMPSPTLTLLPTPKPTPTDPILADAVVNVSTLKMHSGPGSVYDDVGDLGQATELRVIGQVLDCTWLLVVSPDGTEGWVLEDELTFNIDCGQVPEVEVPATPTPLPEIVIAEETTSAEQDASNDSKPDLIVSSISVDMSKKMTEQTIWYNYTIENIGNAPIVIQDSAESSGVALYVYLSDEQGNELSPNQPIWIPALIGLAPGASHSGSRPGSFKGETRFNPNGTLHLSALIDQDELVDESDETNNLRTSSSLPLTPTSTPIPTETSTVTHTPIPTDTPVPTNTPTLTNTPLPPTSTPWPTSTPAPTNTPIPTNTPTSVIPPTLTPTPTRECLSVAQAVTQSSNNQNVISASVPDTIFDLQIHVSSTTVLKGESISFRATAVSNAPPITYRWNLGDGSALREEQEFNHTYVKVGQYLVSVTAIDEANASATYSINIVVTEPPLTPTPTPTVAPIQGLILGSNSNFVLLGQTVYFTASILEGGNVTWTWDFGDGSIESTSGGHESQVTHIYNCVGSYTARVTASNNISSQSASTSILISSQQ